MSFTTAWIHNRCANSTFLPYHHEVDPRYFRLRGDVLPPCPFITLGFQQTTNSTNTFCKNWVLLSPTIWWKCNESLLPGSQGGVPSSHHDLNYDEWYNAGGAMGTIMASHPSPEYLHFLCIYSGTEGHTGVHFCTINHFDLGEQALPEHSLRKSIILLICSPQKGYTKQHLMPSGAFALELAQGWILAQVLHLAFESINFLTFILWSYGVVYRPEKHLLRGSPRLDIENMI